MVHQFVVCQTFLACPCNQLLVTISGDRNGEEAGLGSGASYPLFILNHTLGRIED